MIKKLFNKEKSIKTPVKQQAAVPSSKNVPSTQSWFPVADIHSRMIFRRDGHLVSAIRVQPVNIHLLSDKEKRMRISSLHEVFNGVDFPLQILSISKPVDLDGYIARLEQMRNEETNFLKRRLLDGYIRQAATLATGGEALERHFYILISQAPSKKQQNDIHELMAKTNELSLNLTGAGLTSNVCSDQELRDLLFIFTNPTQASFERAPQTSEEMLQGIYMGG